MEFWVFLIYTGYKICMCFLIFFWFVAHDFMFLTGLLKEQLSIYGEEQSATFSCVACALCALLKKLLPNPRSERFSSRIFMVPSFSFKEWVIVQGVSEWLNFYFWQMGVQLPWCHSAGKTHSFHWTEQFSYLHGKSMGCTDVTISGLCSVPLIHVSVLSPIPHLDYLTFLAQTLTFFPEFPQIVLMSIQGWELLQFTLYNLVMDTIKSCVKTLWQRPHKNTKVIVSLPLQLSHKQKK